MRRRSGFTLVEVLVSMALILFIMSILAAAFAAATQPSATSSPPATWPRSCAAPRRVAPRPGSRPFLPTAPRPASPERSDFWSRLSAPLRRSRLLPHLPADAGRIGRESTWTASLRSIRRPRCCITPSPCTASGAATSCRRSSPPFAADDAAVADPAPATAARAAGPALSGYARPNEYTIPSWPKSPSSSCRTATRRTARPGRRSRCSPVPPPVPRRPDGLDSRRHRAHPVAAPGHAGAELPGSQHGPDGAETRSARGGRQPDLQRHADLDHADPAILDGPHQPEPAAGRVTAAYTYPRRGSTPRWARSTAASSPPTCC